MASITSAQSGLASATSTWVGGVVPGTTFAGTRTTTGAAVALGATSIPVASAAQVVTAGKRIKVAGDPNTYRVATGVAGGASGNIVIDAPGLLVAIPASATTVSVDMVDDKVTIAHPGTNNAGSTLYQLNGARTAGDTTIPVNTGSGTIVAGECVQFLHQLGVDEDGQPYYDNTYYRVTTGITGSGSLVVTPGLAYSMASGVQVINRGHVVELDGAYCWGDDTSSSSTLTNNGVPISGTLKASRSISSALTVRGTCLVIGGGTIDLGATSDIIPDGVTVTLSINDSAVLGVGKHALTSISQTNPTFKMRGVKRTRNTRLSTGVASNAGSVTVDASVGWKVGDRLVVASDTDNPNRAQIVTITGGAPPSWNVSPNITNARAAGTRIGNLSSNVVVKASSAANPGPVSVQYSGNSASPAGLVDIGDIRAENIGSSTVGWSGFGSAPPYQTFAFALARLNRTTVARVAAEATGAASQVACVDFDSPSINAHYAKDWAVYTVLANAVYAGNVGSSVIKDCVTYSCAQGLRQTFGAMASLLVEGGESWCSGVYTLVDSCYAGIARDHKIHSVAQLAQCRLGLMTFEGCDISSSALTVPVASSVTGGLQLNGCTVASGTLAGSNTTGGAPQQSQVSILSEVNGAASDNRVLGYYISALSDTTTRKRSTYAIKIQSLVANTAITYTFTLPAVAGVQQTIKGSLRFDSTYGTATPPRINLSGQGVTQSKTCAAVADAWDDFTFTFTPTSTGDITATVTVQSASTSGFAWLDGVYHFPMTQSVRHFGYLWQAQAAQVVDPTITVSEATALAYPVTVNHGTSTITVTGNATARQVYEACMADLVQTANQGAAVHISALSGGDSFSTSYEVVLGSGVALTGAYTDALGLHVAVEATLPTSGCRIQLYDVTAGIELDNQEAVGTSYSYPITYDTYTAGHTLRLRVAQAGASTAKLPQEVFAALTTGGAVFTVPDEDDTVYAANGIDGSTCDVSGGGEFTADYPNLQIDVSDVDGVTSVQRVYAWSAWANTTTQGIRLMFAAVEALDTLNYVIHQDVVDAKFDNVSVTPVLIVGGYIRRADGSTVIAAASGSIQMDPGRAYVASGASLAADVWASPSRTLTDGSAANVLAVKAKTDNLPADPADASDIAASFSAAAAMTAAIKAKTDNLPASPAAVGDIPTTAQVADKLLGRNLAGGSDGGRTVKDALRASRNRSQLSGGTLTVYQEDDATPAWTADVTTATRDPISGIDPA